MRGEVYIDILEMEKFLNGGLSLGVKWLCHDTNHSYPLTLKVKKDESYTSTRRVDSHSGALV